MARRRREVQSFLNLLATLLFFWLSISSLVSTTSLLHLLLHPHFAPSESPDGFRWCSPVCHLRLSPRSPFRESKLAKDEASASTWTSLHRSEICLLGPFGSQSISVLLRRTVSTASDTTPLHVAFLSDELHSWLLVFRNASPPILNSDLDCGGASSSTNATLGFGGMGLSLFGGPLSNGPKFASSWIHFSLRPWPKSESPLTQIRYRPVRGIKYYPWKSD